MIVDGVPKYGGDFKELIHSGNFCADGLVTHDRKFKAGSLNAKAVYQYMTCSLEGTKLSVTNLYDFTNLNEYTFKYECVVDGEVVESKSLILDLEPKETAYMECHIVENCKLGAYVNCYLYDNVGYEVAMVQLDMGATCEKIKVSAGNINIDENDREYLISDRDFSCTISKIHGGIVSIVKNGEEQLKEPVRLTVMRAPIDNEMTMKVQWYTFYNNRVGGGAEGFDRIFNKCYSCTRTGNMITVSGALSGVGKLPFFKYTIDYTFYENGVVGIDLKGDIREDCVWLPRLGFEFITPYEKDAFRYYGRGEGENYCDMHYHTKIGFFESDADNEYVNYIMPQEHGNHCNTKILEMKDGLKFKSDIGFEFNVSHYSADGIMKAMHIDELVKEQDTIIRIDYKNSGLGSNSCGSALLEKYRLNEKRIESFRFYIV